MEARIAHAAHPLVGELRLPTDKSISHRAVLLAAMAQGESDLIGVLDSADVRSTIGAVRALGATVDVVEAGPRGLRLKVSGWGEGGPVSPHAPIDCGNSGTTARLLLGVLAGWPVDVTLTGDDSLSRRPMRRVAEPLQAMGARVETSATGTMPVRIVGSTLSAIDWTLPVASAQVKTAILLAGMRAPGTTAVSEPAASRDHTERMLPEFGVVVRREGLTARVEGPVVPQSTRVIVPADPSSAAFVCVAALLVPGSHVRLPNVSLNPGRAAFVDVLRRMGGRITSHELPAMGHEPVGTIDVRYTKSLKAVDVTAEEVPALVDEVPILALAATQAAGVTRFDGVRELRVKESDRLEAIATGLSALGASVHTGEDWLEVEGPTSLRGADLASLGDHRLAMTWAVAGLLSSGETVVEGFDAIEVSYPAFLEDIMRLAEGETSS